jgi:Beta-propeller repeat
MRRSNEVRNALLVFCAGITNIAVASGPPPVVLWGTQIGTEREDGADAVAVDMLGNVFVSGITGGNLGGANRGDFDVFVARFDGSNGSRVWTQQFGTSSFDRAFAVSVDNTGGLYVAGETHGSIGASHAGNNDIFLQRYNIAGIGEWSRQLGTAAFDRGTGVVADSLGNVYVGGYTEGSLEGTSAGSFDGTVSKFVGSRGGLSWTRQFGTPGQDALFAIAADGAGNVFVTGSTTGDLAGPNAGERDGYLSKFDGNGNRLWTHQFGSPQSEEPSGVAVDSAGNAYVAGFTRGSLAAPFAGGTFDAFLTKVSADGQPEWTVQLGTDGTDGARAVAVDSSGNIFIAGLTSGALGGPFQGGSSDAFLAKYDAGANLEWIRQFGTDGYDDVNDVKVQNGNIYLVGNTDRQMFAPPAGDNDFFIIKLREVPEPHGVVLAIVAISIGVGGRRPRTCG